MAGGGCMGHPSTVTVMIQQECTNPGRLNLIRWLLLSVGPRYRTYVTPQALIILRSLIDFNEICAFLWYGITECLSIKRRRSRLYASRTSSGIQELNADEAHDATPILLCAHVRRLTRCERTLLACLISCMFLSPILSIRPKFSRESDAKFTDKTGIKAFVDLLCLAGAFRSNTRSLEE